MRPVAAIGRGAQQGPERLTKVGRKRRGNTKIAQARGKDLGVVKDGLQGKGDHAIVRPLQDSRLSSPRGAQPGLADVPKRAAPKPQVSRGVNHLQAVRADKPIGNPDLAGKASMEDLPLQEGGKKPRVVLPTTP